MATRRRYTKADRAAAVGLAVVKGTEAAAEELGIPRTTLAYWMDKPEFVELRQKSADQVAEAMWVAMQAGIARVVELIPLTEDIAKVSIALGVLYDKRALLTGGATSRAESRALTEDFDDHERRQLRDILDGALRSAAEAPAGDPG